VSDDDWITPLIAKSKAGPILVASHLAGKLEELLRGPLGERELPKGELTSIAKELVASISAVRQQPKAQR
jgi:hypothetical protein